MKKTLLYSFPGLFQLSQKKYIQGFLAFLFVFTPILFLIKIDFFMSYPVSDKYKYVLFGIFSIGIIFHFITVILKKTEPIVDKLSPEEFYEKGRIAFLKGNYELALLHFENLYNIKSNDEDVIYQLGKIYLELNKNKKAVKLYNNYLKSSGKKWKKEIEIILEEQVKINENNNIK